MPVLPTPYLQCIFSCEKFQASACIRTCFSIHQWYHIAIRKCGSIDACNVKFYDGRETVCVFQTCGNAYSKCRSTSITTESINWYVIMFVSLREDCSLTCTVWTSYKRFIPHRGSSSDTTTERHMHWRERHMHWSCVNVRFYEVTGNLRLSKQWKCHVCNWSRELVTSRIIAAEYRQTGKPSISIKQSLRRAASRKTVYVCSSYVDSYVKTAVVMTPTDETAAVEGRLVSCLLLRTPCRFWRIVIVIVCMWQFSVQIFIHSMNACPTDLVMKAIREVPCN